MKELKRYEINETELAKCAYAVLSTERGDINIKKKQSDMTFFY